MLSTFGIIGRQVNSTRSGCGWCVSFQKLYNIRAGFAVHFTATHGGGVNTMEFEQVHYRRFFYSAKFHIK